LAEGACEGRIVHEERGAHGFGYDPLFEPRGYDKTFAELGAEVKDRISHRGRALEKAKDVLRKLI
jgi:XTP/dITP diphosphohydrolase